MARFRVKTRRIIITIRKFHVYSRDKKGRGKEKKMGERERKRETGAIHRSYIGEFLATGELIVYKHSVAGWLRAYIGRGKLPGACSSRPRFYRYIYAGWKRCFPTRGELLAYLTHALLEQRARRWSTKYQIVADKNVLLSRYVCTYVCSLA